MTMHNEDHKRKDWAEETARLSEVSEVIAGQIEVLEEETGKLQEVVVDIRQHFWDEVSVNVESADDILETETSIIQQVMVLNERERMHDHADKILGQLYRMKPSPYFGRVDFYDPDMKDTEQIFIGLASLRNEETMDYYVYDWRAPISGLFYDHTPGQVRYDTPSGFVEGTMALKRQYVIKQGELQYYFDTGDTIGDQLLQQVLGQSADAHMKNIVATIQKDQNAIIRHDQSRVLVVSGSAGSGKTSVALQRIAYLLYKHRKWLTSNHMLLFSPNPLYNSYISTVLPELGETNMRQTTFQSYLDHRLASHYTLEDAYDQLEQSLTAKPSPELASFLSRVKYKASAEFFTLMQRYVQYLESDELLFRSIIFRDEVLISAEAIRQHFYTERVNMKLNHRIEALQQWLQAQLELLAKEEAAKPWVADEMEWLDESAYQQAFMKLRRQKRSVVSFSDDQDERTVLAEMIVRKRFKTLRKFVAQLHFLDIKATYRQLFAPSAEMMQSDLYDAAPADWSEICRHTLAMLDQDVLQYEDATPYLFLVEMIEGVQSYNAVKYVVVDEAQDYSIFQLQMMKALFPGSKLTLLGDWNQAIMTHAPEVMNDFGIVEAIFPSADIASYRLRQSYRSTYEIVQFTREMVPDGKQIEPFNRHGKLPQVKRLSSYSKRDAALMADWLRLQQEGCTSIAIICKSQHESEQAYTALQAIWSGEMPIQLIDKLTTTFESGFVIIPAYLAKGMEFDVVLIYNGSKECYGHSFDRRLFYTACTRAMHQLYLYAVGEWCDFVQQVDGSLMERYEDEPQ